MAIYPIIVRFPVLLKALANEDTLIVADTLLPTQMFPRLPARATLVADTNFVSGTQKMFLIIVLFRNILCPQQMFPSLRSPRNILGNNVSATMCPRLPGHLARARCLTSRVFVQFTKPAIRGHFKGFLLLNAQLKTPLRLFCDVVLNTSRLH